VVNHQNQVNIFTLSGFGKLSFTFLCDAEDVPVLMTEWNGRTVRF
jgi:hypothetical protein